MTVQIYSYKNYPDLPTDLKNSTTPYIGINNYNEGVVEPESKLSYE